ncbi:MAG: chemotaxis protein CheX [Candidatus Zixiibacteriota bacterium]
MDKQMLENKLEDITMSVLEQAAFIFADPMRSRDNLEFADIRTLQISIDYEGEAHGTLLFIIPEAICSEIHCNMLGENETESMTADCCHDAAKEIINIIGGHFLTEIYGRDAGIRLATPDIREIATDEIRGLISQNPAAVLSTGEHCLCTVAIMTEKEYEYKGSGS